MTSDGVPIDPPNTPAGAPELQAPVGKGNAPGCKATQFKPGEPRPEGAGRKKGTPNRATIFQKILAAKASEFYKEKMKGKLDDVDPETLGDQLAAMLAIQALEGDNRAMQLIFDSALGKQKERMEVTVTPLAKVLEDIEQNETGLPNVK